VTSVAHAANATASDAHAMIATARRASDAARLTS
jgi:hypothetical protein